MTRGTSSGAVAQGSFASVEQVDVQVSSRGKRLHLLATLRDGTLLIVTLGIG